MTVLTDAGYMALDPVTCLPIPGVDPDPPFSAIKPIGPFVTGFAIDADEFVTTSMAPFDATTPMVSEEPIKWA